MENEVTAPGHGRPVTNLFMAAKMPYDALKLNCAIRWNVGALEKRYRGGGHPGTLNARQDLIDLIADAGGNFQAEPGFQPAQDGELRRGAGTGYVGWVDFETRAGALSYLGRYFILSDCPDEQDGDDPQPAAPSMRRAGRKPINLPPSKRDQPGLPVKRPKRDLEQLGFLDEACWGIDADGALVDIGDDKQDWEDDCKKPRALYAFCTGEEVLYIGKTARTIKSRFSGYKNPGESQQTNQRCHQEIRRLLKEGKAVRILVLTDPAKLSYGGFAINLAAGLEDALVAEFQPRLNGTGNPRRPKIRTSSEEDELAADKETPADLPDQT